jgi:hypothetical protein
MRQAPERLNPRNQSPSRGRGRFPSRRAVVWIERHSPEADDRWAEQRSCVLTLETVAYRSQFNNRAVFDGESYRFLCQNKRQQTSISRGSTTQSTPDSIGPE